MNILLVSQCEKRALSETRRILDQFAERRGERTWQTPITQAGLDTLRRLLKKSARRNTAVACHWIRGRDHSELLWIVGDASRFNAQGAVPTNRTRRDILRKEDENDWHSAEDIRLLTVMAALFHDIGKASQAFQAKLRNRGKPMADAYRHEWVSLRLFEAFVGPGSSDEDWLRRLADKRETGDAWLSQLARDDRQPAPPGPFQKSRLPPLAQAVGWLIVSHHRLPNGDHRGSASLARLPAPIQSQWCGARDADAKEKDACWQFPHGLPFASPHWRARTALCAQSMLERPGLLARGPALLHDSYVMHVSRLILMLADHHYSSLPADSRLGDPNFPLHANTDRDSGQLKQRLDEHLLGVALHSRKLAGTLPRLERQLPRLARHKGFTRRVEQPRFRWQDKAYDCAMACREQAMEHGFFGLNLASTGCGKTLANGRILYALADPQRGARFSIALGLRSLTLQTGQAYRERLGLGDDDLAILVGGSAARELFEKQQERLERSGSESAQELLAENSHVHFAGTLEDGPLREWLGRNSAGNRLLQAPILACTIDHLMPASESLRGGHQIAPLLRLMTSDLVLDEVDDFDIDDLPALSRLVHWAGLFGSRVLLSSATLPPALVQGLFEAYRSGREIFQRHRGAPGRATEICCAWFDEFSSQSSAHGAVTSFSEAHATFVAQRLAKLEQLPPRRQAQLCTVHAAGEARPALCRELAGQMNTWMADLHRCHHTEHQGRRISFGLLRLANIEPLIELAQAILAQGAPEGLHVHLCVYHSRHPLLVRSAIERQLDELLKRSDDDAAALFARPTLAKALQASTERDHLFVVLASPVAEVGRDHDYDWAIVEPSSMRSIIQLAGRIRRHRSGFSGEANLYLLSRNIRSLEGQNPAFQRPGFETPDFPLDSHDLHDLLDPVLLARIDASPRIVEPFPLFPRSRLVDLEHRRLRALMLADDPPTSLLGVPLWWQTPASLSGALQTSQPFRAGAKERCYALLPDEDDEERLHFSRYEEGTWSNQDNLLRNLDLTYGPRIQTWGTVNYREELVAMAGREDLDLRQCAMRYGEVRLRENTQGWSYHPYLGFKKYN
ncbi:type I-F CRISPR-associated helicase Cas3 [Pseudomonas aeruginosa]|nr:type I-F CRISPR-associated helicase Cas3 [Pseudomonas aeruginosa]MBG6708355.1 type I-F CRISPR-associated helicase Cas3 [Pseudomonas aeruginosa]MCW5508298.1 type I-F CRISPR-associated helicase Cas3 [Pseudomonas aeruginosa]HEK0891023.1 type I-F CRISPR-associated helicase Cas3 [Pseudomonas aeruginosa]